MKVVRSALFKEEIVRALDLLQLFADFIVVFHATIKHLAKLDRLTSDQSLQHFKGREPVEVINLVEIHELIGV